MLRFFQSPYLRLFLALILVVVLGVFGINYALQPMHATEQQNEKAITVYSAIPGDIVYRYLAAFQAEYPDIEVTLVDGLTLQLAQQLLAEKDAPNADVIWGLAVTSMLPLEWNYLLTFYRPAGIERIDPLFRDANEPPQWVGIAARSIVFCVNQAELAKNNLPLPQSWLDLVNPIYKGKLLVLSPGTTSVGYLLMSTILQRYGDIEGWDYLAQLHENTEGVYASQAPGVCRRVREGEYWIGVTYDYRAYFPEDEAMTLVVPSDETGWDLEVNALIHKEHIKEAAKLFLDWAISDSAMQQYAQDRVITAAETELKIMDSASAEQIRQQLYDLDIPWTAANRERIQGEWVALYREQIKEMVNTAQ
ncbi:MAG: extracellular solute-binding protein [Caldilineaceae bacterium]|nr:extracellular solute-binding protein [Caldilineaceae bacterium]